MNDRELFRRGLGLLPGEVGPLLLVQGGKRLFVLAVGAMGLQALMLEGLGDLSWASATEGVLLALLGLAGTVFFSLLELGAFRFCLDRGEGAPGRLPWTILPQWRVYKSWCFWAGVVPFLWQTARPVVRAVLSWRMDDMAFALWSERLSLFNLCMVPLSYLLFMLLALAVWTVYLRDPERGFWRAVGSGVALGLKRWTWMIGFQVKVILPVWVLQLVLVAVFGKLAGVGTVGMMVKVVCSIAAGVWTTGLYGTLAGEKLKVKS